MSTLENNNKNLPPTKNNSNNNNNKASIGLVIGCIVFGMGSLIVAHVDVGSYAMSFWRLLVAGVIFLILSILFKQPFPKSKKAFICAIISGVFLGYDLALWHESIHAVGPGISTLLNSLQIFFLAAIGFIWFNERQSKQQLFSLFIAITGVTMIGSPEFAVNKDASWGFISGIVSGGMLAGSMTFIRKTHEAAPTPILPLMTALSLGGAISLIPVMLWLDQGRILPTSMNDLLWILVYGAVMQCMAWGLIAHSIPKLSLAVTGLLLLTEPVAALVIDYFWLAKDINIIQWTGALLTMFAIYLGSVKSPNSEDA